MLLDLVIGLLLCILSSAVTFSPNDSQIHTSSSDFGELYTHVYCRLLDISTEKSTKHPNFTWPKQISWFLTLKSALLWVFPAQLLRSETLGDAIDSFLPLSIGASPNYIQNLVTCHHLSCFSPRYHLSVDSCNSLHSSSGVHAPS